MIENSRQYLLLRTDILQKTLVGCSWINSVFCDSTKCGSQIVDFIQASLLRPGFELSQTVDFKKGVTFCDNSICVQTINHESHRHLSRKTSEFTAVSQSAVIGHFRKNTNFFLRQWRIQHKQRTYAFYTQKIGLWPQGGYSGFQVTGMIEGFFGVSNFRFRDFLGYENLTWVAWFE